MSHVNCMEYTCNNINEALFKVLLFWQTTYEENVNHVLINAFRKTAHERFVSQTVIVIVNVLVAYRIRDWSLITGRG